LQQYEAAASDKYMNAKKANAREIIQDAHIIKREENFKTFRRLFRDQKLDLEAHKAEVLDLHKFESEKKYLEDTDESDDHDDEEDISDEE
jgi:hypothetical protein